jgi:hypothetical protein
VTSGTVHACFFFFLGNSIDVNVLSFVSTCSWLHPKLYGLVFLEFDVHFDHCLSCCGFSKFC